MMTTPISRVDEELFLEPIRIQYIPVIGPRSPMLGGLLVGR